MKAIIALILLVPFYASAEKLIVKFKDKPETSFVKATKLLSKDRVMDGQIAIIDGNISDFEKHADVEYVERDFKVHVLGYPSKRIMAATSPKAWGITKTQAATFWGKGFKGKGIKVAVIDTGVDGNHPELKGRVLPGFNAIDGSTNAVDDMGHGTHCAGTIGGKDVGMAPEVSIVPVKFLDADGSGNLSDAIKAIEWATKQNVQIMSNSWGGGGYSKALKDVIDAARKKGIWFTAAAGNESNNNDKNPSYPASYKLSNIVSVAATDSSDVLADFSNFGAKSVYIAAPGVAIYSSLPGGKYEAWDGTSMATPHVSGAAALLLQSGCKDIPVCLKKNFAKVTGLKKQVKLGGRLEMH